MNLPLVVLSSWFQGSTCNPLGFRSGALLLHQNAFIGKSTFNHYCLPAERKHFLLLFMEVETLDPVICLPI